MGCGTGIKILHLASELSLNFFFKSHETLKSKMIIIVYASIPSVGLLDLIS